MLAAAVFAGFALAIVAPWIHRVARNASGWILAIFPLALTFYFAGFIGPVVSGRVFSFAYPWTPSLGISLSFYLDGLSLLFALLISGIGALVLVYAGSYQKGHPHLGRLQAYLLMFAASMLGLVLADNVITLFVFWELTSVSSYLLIGFDHERESARRSALQALLVTALGGLALLAGLLLLGQAGGSLELSELLHQRAVIQAHPLYGPILLLILAGAFTKSAQVPFHFWLPAAMEAPTAVSAYLHSATMVKAGVYLLARLLPVLGGTEAWIYTVTIFGTATMLVGAFLAFRQTDLKLILAYSTVSALGTLVLLLGLGTALAVQAAIVYLLAHALYKAALFLVAGAVDHETGTRDVRHLGGLRHCMPVTAAAAALAAVSMAGLPPLLGFIGKETFFEAVLETRSAAGMALTVAAVLSAMLYFAIAITTGLRPFVGTKTETPRKPHEAPLGLWLGPWVLAGLALFLGLAPALTAEPLVSSTVAGILGEPPEVSLALFHGWSPVLLLSGVTIAGGLGLYAGRNALLRKFSVFSPLSRWGASRWYEGSLQGLNALARLQTRVLQSGYLRFYLLTVIATTVGLTGYTLLSRVGISIPEGGLSIPLYQLSLVLLILLATIAAVRSRSRLGAVASLGVVGYSIALIFVLFGAPDLAMAQFLVESLTVILLVLILYHLPRFAVFSRPRDRVRDAIVSLLAGGLMTGLVLAAASTHAFPSISSFYGDHSATAAHGRNIVNVILVDFRALDTLGEITVLAVAGIGVYSLLKLRLGKGDSR